jgi:rhomboid-like protein
MLVQGIELQHYSGSFLTLPSPDDASYIMLYGDNAAKVAGIFTPIVGASGAIFGVLVGFGMLYPDLELMLLFVPVPIKAKYIIPIYILIELVSGFGQFTGDNVAHFAHLGGALLGFIMIKVWRYR